ncbi:MAG: hypothetical protein RIR51_1141 [Bacteroidota bacterium]|jgi:hypothetical protein
MNNPGFTQAEIDNLKSLCKQANQSFIFIDDEDLPVSNENEMVHIQFIGKHEGQEVIYDAILFTLQLHYSSLIYEEAERQAVKKFPLYVPLEKRDETYQENEAIDEEVEMMVLEIIEELEEEDSLKVSEYLDIDLNFEFGIGLEAALYIPKLEEDVIEKFIQDFNNGRLKLDTTLYSFKSNE